MTKKVYTFREVIERIKPSEKYTDGLKTIKCELNGDININFHSGIGDWNFCFANKYTLVEQPKIRVHIIDVVLTPLENPVKMKVSDRTYELIERKYCDDNVFLSLRNNVTGIRSYAVVNEIGYVDLTEQELKDKDFEKNYEITGIW